MVDSRHGEPRGFAREPRDAGQPLRASWDPEARALQSAGGNRSRGGRRRGGIRRWIETWGWRAYAIPVLLVISAAVVVDAVRSPELSDTSSSVVQPPAADSQVLPALPRVVGPIPAMGELPAGGKFEQNGSGEFHMVPGRSERQGKPQAELFTFTIEVENGINTNDFGGDSAVAQMIEATLFNPKSWTADGKVAFQRIDRGDPTFRVSLTTPGTVRTNCGYSIKLETSCFNPQTERVYLNLSRWVRGSAAFEGDMGSYRQYLINHEVGHAVGHPNHPPCPKSGDLAPVMMQQTISLSNNDLHELDPEGLVQADNKSCRYNAWPFPEA